MTKLLKQAFDRAAQLPEVEQEALAAILLAEIEDEARWQASFAKSQAKLAKMAKEALAEDRAGQTTSLDFNRKR